MMRKRIITVLFLFVFVAFNLLAQDLTFSFTHRVGDPKSPTIVVRRAPNGEPVSENSNGYSVAFLSDGSAFKDVAVIGVEYVGSYSINLRLSFSSFSSAGGNVCSYTLSFIDPHTGNDRTKLVDDATESGACLVLTSYPLSDQSTTDDLVLLSMKADTEDLPIDNGVEQTTYTMTVQIEVSLQ